MLICDPVVDSVNFIERVVFVVAVIWALRKFCAFLFFFLELEFGWVKGNVFV